MTESRKRHKRIKAKQKNAYKRKEKWITYSKEKTDGTFLPTHNS